ncbi:hypothetical protein D3C81_1511940 [compost metagenome]
MRILHFVQHQHQGLAFGGFDQALQFVLVPQLGCGITRDHALVAHLAGHAAQCLRVDLAHVDTLAQGFFFNFDQARVLGTGLDQDFTNVLRVLLDRRSHGIDADDPLVLLAHWRHMGGNLGGNGTTGE